MDKIKVTVEISKEAFEKVHGNYNPLFQVPFLRNLVWEHLQESSNVINLDEEKFDDSEHFEFIVSALSAMLLNHKLQNFSKGKAQAPAAEAPAAEAASQKEEKPAEAEKDFVDQFAELIQSFDNKKKDGDDCILCLGRIKSKHKTLAAMSGNGTAIIESIISAMATKQCFEHIIKAAVNLFDASPERWRELGKKTKIEVVSEEA